MVQTVPVLLSDPQAGFASGRVKKMKSVPCCRRRIGLLSGEMSGLIAHCVRRVLQTLWVALPTAQNLPTHTTVQLL
jgi:hypothetical protein